MSHSFLTFGWEPSAVVETERPSVCGSLLCGRYLLQGGQMERYVCVGGVFLCDSVECDTHVNASAAHTHTHTSLHFYLCGDTQTTSPSSLPQW